MPPELIWRNGEFVKWADATVHVTAHALHYGSSVFEGIRAYKTSQGPAVFRLEPHMQRLLNSCKIAKINLPYSAEELSKAVVETVRRNGHEACYIRPIVFRSTTAQELVGLEGRKVPVEVVIFTDDWGRYLGTEALDNGVDVQVSSWRRMAPDTFASMAKIGGQYVNSQFVSMEAHDNGFSEGIALDVSGYVSEGAGENLFVVVGDVVYTPGVWQSILSGVTRDSVLTILRDLGYTIRYEPVAREMLYIADEMFFTGTAAEVTPIRSVDRLPVGEGKPGPVTKAVQKEFFAITSGQKPDPYGWLTLVKQTEAAD